jgi:mannosyltransferase
VGIRLSGERLWPLAPLAVGLVSFGLGLIHLTKYPWWHDEQVTARVAGGSLSGIWRAARQTEQPHFLFYVLDKAWFGVIGGPQHHHWLARFPSVVWLALAAATLTLLGTHLFGRVVGLVGGLVLATNFLLLHWEQFARDLTISLFLATFATYAFVRMIETERGTRWIWIWAVSLLAAAWIELFGVCVIAGHAAAYLVLAWMRGRRPHQRLELALGAGAFALTVPNVVLVATANNGQLNWIPPVTVHRLYDQSWIWAGRNPFAVLGCLVGLAVLGLLVLPVSESAKDALVRPDTPGVEPWKAVLVVVCLLAPFVVTLVLSAIQPAFAAQYLFAATPALALLLGVAIVYTHRWIGLPLLVGAVVAAGLLTANYVALPPYAGFTFTP